MSGEVDRDRVVEAFDSAIDYWHEQIDNEIDDHADNDDRPTTAREYFEDDRGFDAATIDEWRLGWAPGDGDLHELLTEQGFATDVIAATGLFCESDPEKELWRGRYVLPYFAADGRAEYAIARCTGSKGGGAAGYDGHRNDFLAGKYAKVAHTRDNVPLSEPILGLHTLADADEVVIAEGIADAISAHEAGYAVLSPVTKEFKQEHFEVVVDAIDEHAIERAYVVPDAEIAGFAEIDSEDVPEEPENIYEAINLPTVAPGPGGGLRTANYLQEQGVDARLVELPQPSAGKVDLDDYLQGWADGLDAPLLSSKPPVEHPQYDAATATQDTEANASGNISNSDQPEQTPSTSTRGSSASGLFSLDVGDVNDDLEDDYRGRNPLGHTGNSEDYFVVNKHPESGDLIAKDYKRPGNPRYTGCTYLLVELEERPVEGPMGELSPRETWIAWAEARERGLLTEDDVIPEKALRYIARDRDLYNFEALPEDTDELPPKACNRALWWLNERWAEENLSEDEDATARRGKARSSVVLTWEDVRYIYEDDKDAARHGAESLLKSEHDFMTIDEYDQLHVYDEETGTYNTELAEIRGKIKDGLGKHWSTHEANEILARLRQSPRPSVDDLNGEQFDTPHICVKNGVLDIFSKELKEHSPEHYFTNRMPSPYDPNADAGAYNEFLDELTDREEDKMALLEMVGHAITPDAYSRGWKKFLILTGDTNNGKSVFFSRVQSLLNGPEGREGNTANVKIAKIARNQFSNNSVYGKWANIAGEIDGKKIRNTASVKDITGGDPVEIEPKGEDSFFDSLDATFMFAANDPPIIGERDKDAIASRIVPIELPYTFVDNPDGEYERQKKSERELREWLDTDEALAGFLRLAVEGANRLNENDGDVSLPESNKERLRMYERKADPMREFGERCLTNSDEDYLVKADVTTIYKEFASSMGHEVGQNTNKTLHNVLRGLPDLNYTDSRPRSPDYTDTSMNLRGWDERKFVINRVKLTEEGLEMAESAGLVEEDDALVPPDPSDRVVTLDEANPEAMIDGAEMPPVRATVTAIWEDRYGNPVGELEANGATIDVHFAGCEVLLEVPVSEGAKYEFAGLYARTPEGKKPYVEHRPTTDASVLELPDGEADADPDGSATDTTETAATDGGEGEGEVEGEGDGSADGDVETEQTDDVNQSLIKNATEKIATEHDSGDQITAPAFAAQMGISGEQGEAVLERLTTEKGKLERLDEGYRVI